ncbi:DUF4349 domain-containing protein [Bizionia saleffrena]|uniref:DUF4349 domain-containing protein n=1 Tax=Bizionia saleffrena TaxID=291189 RepID=A0A8H2LGQ6_9FLAO|nr:DUF4349 domain-containing protein [Bizionia saleffrena]TYB74153.1 DUF4349 domain-containing protein [Bizionia saleffrena]
MKMLIYLFVLVLPLACSQNKSISDTESYNESYEIQEIAEESEFRTFQNNTTKDTDYNTDQKLIKESYLEFETKDLDQTYAQITRFITENKGYIQDDTASKNYNRITRSLIIRVPNTHFQTTINSISQSVNYFDTKRMSSKDVTEEFIDIEARLKAKKALEVRYLELLSKANTVIEMLEIEKELSNIREDIEATQGRLKYLSHKVSLSTIRIVFYKTIVESKVTESYGSKMWLAIKSGFNSLSLFMLGVLKLWPFIIVIGISSFFFKRWLHKKSKK